MLATKPYNREKAVAYAARWARGRNPLFYNFTGVGGDCTNFVSQSVLAGSCVMNFTPDFGWYYRSESDRAPAFTGVEFFWDFFTGAPDFAAENGGIGPFGREVSRALVRRGDVVQLADGTGDFYHSLLVSAVLPQELLLSAHTNDALNRPLSSYEYAAVRFIHIEGVRVAYPDYGCYRDLVEGIALPNGEI